MNHPEGMPPMGEGRFMVEYHCKGWRAWSTKHTLHAARQTVAMLSAQGSVARIVDRETGSIVH